MAHALGAIPSKHDERDFPFFRLGYGMEALPSVVDNIAAAPAIRDQGALGACTGFGISGAVELAYILKGRPVSVRSPLWLYWQERYLEHTVNQDSGAMPRDGLRVVHKVGIDSEADWPYDISRFTEAPPRDLIVAAESKVSFHRCNSAIEIKQALANKHPVVIGFTVFESFEDAQVAATGVVPMPGPDESVLGGHCVYVLGYTDVAHNGLPPNYLICANSWSDQWGAKGFFFMPYEYLTPSLEYVSDLFAVVV